MKIAINDETMTGKLLNQIILDVASESMTVKELINQTIKYSVTD